MSLLLQPSYRGKPMSLKTNGQNPVRGMPFENQKLTPGTGKRTLRKISKKSLCYKEGSRIIIIEEFKAFVGIFKENVLHIVCFIPISRSLSLRCNTYVFVLARAGSKDQITAPNQGLFSGADLFTNEMILPAAKRQRVARRFHWLPIFHNASGRSG